MKKSSFGVNIGSSSILLIFVILCLVSFAALSIVSSNADYKLGKKVMERTTNYYEASNAAQEKIAGIKEALVNAYQTSSGDSEAYFETVGHNISFIIPISDLQELSVSLEILYPENKGDKIYKINEYRVVTKDNIQYDDTVTGLQ